MRSFILTIFAAALLLPATLRAGSDLFELTADATSGTPLSASAGGSNLPDLVSNVIDSEDEFAAFDGRSFDATLDYGGVENAVLLSRNASGTSATLTIPSTGFTRTFTGSNSGDVEDQIRDFLLKDGQEEYAKFLRVINEQSMIGVIDGNPLAATALLADGAFDRFGAGRGMVSPADTGMLESHGGWRLNLSGGFESTDDGDGSHASAGLSKIWRFGDRVGLALGSDFTWRNVEDADVFHFGSHIGLPIVIIGPGTKGIVWQVTPLFQAGASGSADLAAGGTIMGGSIASALRIPVGKRFSVTIGNQFSFYEGYQLNIFNYSWDTDASQQLLKNGVRLSYAITDHLFIDGGLTHTSFLQDAAIDSYLTPAAGVGLYFTGKQTSGLRLGYRGDFGDGYDGHGGTAQLFFNY